MRKTWTGVPIEVEGGMEHVDFAALSDDEPLAVDWAELSLDGRYYSHASGDSFTDVATVGDLKKKWGQVKADWQGKSPSLQVVYRVSGYVPAQSVTFRSGLSQSH